VDARGSQGVQVGSYNAQVNNFHAPAPVMVVPSQVVTGAIPARPVGFQPRAALMNALAEVVGSDRVAVVCALTGQRGVGKTQLAAAYARRRVEQKCPVVAWVNAERPESILAGLDALASALGLRREGEDAASGVARLVAELQTRVEPALVVFDNVTDPDHLVGYLPATGATRIILTSTQQSVRNLGQALPVDVYTPGEAIAFLRETTGWDDDTGAGVLAGELGWLPLALAHAAAVIRTREITYPNCVRLIRNYPLPRYLIHQPGQHYPHGSAEAILLSLHDAGFDTDPELARLAGVVALLSPDGFPASCSVHSPRVIPPCWMIGFSVWLAGRSSPTPRVEAR
jgi:AAA domain